MGRFIFRWKPCKRQGQWQRNFANFQVKRTRNYLVIWYDDRFPQMEVVVRVLRITGRELSILDVDPFIGMTFTLSCMEYRISFLSDALLAISLLGAEVIAHVLLGEGLSAVIELRLSC